MTRPFITYDMLKMHPKVLYPVVNQVASLLDFKALFEKQMKQANFQGAVFALCDSSTELKKKIEQYINKDEYYQVILKEMTANIDKFPNVLLPLRASDFVVRDDMRGKVVYFWIRERLEINIDDNGKLITLAKLMVDTESDELLFNDNYGHGWSSYNADTYNTKFSCKVIEQYKSYLAEKVLLEKIDEAE